ncbi:major facilitator superfamily domain-containing protein [Schizophyllum amplum]|uniref:Major facilitator superfamily domain-containing protein n=1 Tax=Schizophyllum amplum TaxID=97359 RepID=A0A550CKM4_9AGAR|nr:major facilitator superfamily domain-containing protein [Auriculariopsis ampla]
MSLSKHESIDQRLEEAAIAHGKEVQAVEDPDAEFGGTDRRRKLERKLLWKIDLRMSILIVIYILNYVDRNNAGAARLKGFEEGLHLQGEEFATLLSILYVGYIIMQIPSNMFLNWIGKPSLYLPACMILWGMMSTLTGICNNFVGALLTRFFLGFVEAAFFPGALFLISKWYKKDEIGLRMAILYCGSIISNAFGALMASGILSGMDGAFGHAAWRWLFFIEGALTMAFALLAIFILPDFPSNTRWLSDEERSLAIRRMEEDIGVGDQSETEAHGQLHGLWLALADWRVWWMAVCITAQVIAVSFNAYFPTLTETLGYNDTVSLLLCAPPFVFAALAAFTVSRHSDKTQERFLHVIIPYLFGIVGFIIAIATTNTAARYVSFFLMAQSYAGYVCFWAWVSNTFPRPPSKRAVAIALVNAISQLGNISGSYIFPKMWDPTYNYSYAICIANAGLGVLMCCFLRWYLGQENLRLEAEERERGVEVKGFRYVL